MDAANPGIELSLEDLHPDVAIERLRQGVKDVAVIFRYDDSQPPGDIRYRHLFDDPMSQAALAKSLWSLGLSRSDCSRASR